MKRILVVLLVLALLSTLVTSVAVAQEPVKLKAVIIKHPLTQELSKMEWLKEAEAIAGVDIEWQEISADWDQVKSTMFASGDIPDLLFNATVDSDYATFDGLFENLAPLINETDTPNIYQFFTDHPEAKTLATMLDGSLYALPKYQRYWPNVATSCYINQQWLTNLGLAMPTNWDELEQVLIAFRDQDANGNGDPNDEIPMDFLGYTGSGSPGQYHALMLLGSTGIQMVNFFQDGYFAEDGVVKSVWTDDRYKETVKYLNKLYSEGLINPETWTNDYSTYQSVARGDGEYAKVGITWGWEATDRFGLTLASQYTALAPLKTSATDTRDVRVEYDRIGLNYDKNRVCMSALSENKEAALRFLDTLYNPEFGLQILWGGMNDVDKCIAKNADGSYTILAPASANMDWGTWKWTMSWADLGPIYISDSMVVNLGTDMVDTLAQRAIYDDYVAKINEKKDLYVEMYMKLTSEEQATSGINLTTINSTVLPNLTAWIIGTQDIDSEWDAYVQYLLSSGLQENLDMRQNAYDNWLSTLQ
ncbi:MAG: extracellular solute-binding protein [Eubacteriales bacterium]|nr:extracellular solute-binding protein [Eubacteriales bacterium]